MRDFGDWSREGRIDCSVAHFAADYLLFRSEESVGWECGRGYLFLFRSLDALSAIQSHARVVEKVFIATLCSLAADQRVRSSVRFFLGLQLSKRTRAGKARSLGCPYSWPAGSLGLRRCLGTGLWAFGLVGKNAPLAIMSAGECVHNSHGRRRIAGHISKGNNAGQGKHVSNSKYAWGFQGS